MHIHWLSLHISSFLSLIKKTKIIYPIFPKICNSCVPSLKALVDVDASLGAQVDVLGGEGNDVALSVGHGWGVDRDIVANSLALVKGYI